LLPIFGTSPHDYRTATSRDHAHLLGTKTSDWPLAVQASARFRESLQKLGFSTT
jgi:hypothetical protein